MVPDTCLIINGYLINFGSYIYIYKLCHIHVEIVASSLAFGYFLSVTRLGTTAARVHAPLDVIHLETMQSLVDVRPDLLG